MKLLWVLVVAVIALVNWYYIQSFHTVATQLRDLRVSLMRNPYEAVPDPIVRLRGDLASAYSAVRTALTSPTT